MAHDPSDETPQRAGQEGSPSPSTPSSLGDSPRGAFETPTPAARAAASPLAQDMAEGKLRIAFQPIVDLINGTVFAQEALGRSASDRFEGPMPMFQEAAQASLVGELGRSLRRLAVQHCPAVPLFVNVHPREFTEGWLLKADEAVFSHNEAVYLEITESMPFSHFDVCQSTLREMRGRGIFLAIDDFGAGYANLKSIADLAPDVIKFDRQLLAGISRDKRQFRLVKHLVRLCSDMGARVIAEGIETKEELQAIVDAGAHFGQGYLLARPDFPAPIPTLPGK